MKTHKDLEAWKVSLVLVSDIYQVTRCFPKSELFGLVDQLRRAAISVPVNISEGAARRSTKEFRYFLGISFGSLSELETLLYIANKLGYVPPETYNEVASKVKLITAQLGGLIKALERKITAQTVQHA